MKNFRSPLFSVLSLVVTVVAFLVFLLYPFGDMQIFVYGFVLIAGVMALLDFAKHRNYAVIAFSISLLSFIAMVFIES